MATEQALLPPPASSSEADQNPDAERQKLSLPPTKVGIICYCGTVQEDTCDILIVDLESARKTCDVVRNEFIRVAPTIRLKREEEEDIEGFCVLGSTVYMFESSDDPEIESSPKSVYTINLSKFDLTKPNSIILEKDELGRAHDMSHPKITPYATPTPDGKKILVFSVVINFEPSAETAGEHDFELYDTDTGLWQDLPGIRDDWNDQYRRYSYSTYFWIHAFTFISKSTFFIKTETGSMYALDLESLDKGWQKWDTFYGASPIPYRRGPFLVIEEELCLTPFGVYDIKKQNQLPDPEWFMFPLPSYGTVIDLFGPTAVILLDDVKNGQFHFCTVETGIGKVTGYPYVTIVAYHCDLAKYREDKEKKGDCAELKTSIKKVKCFKFLLDIEDCRNFNPRNLFLFST